MSLDNAHEDDHLLVYRHASCGQGPALWLPLHRLVQLAADSRADRAPQQDRARVVCRPQPGTTGRDPQRHPAQVLVSCSTVGHEDKAEHGRSGLCQTCYRRQRRREVDPLVGQRKPGPKPDPTAPRSRHANERAGEGTQEGRVGRPRRNWDSVTRCVNGHDLTRVGAYVLASGQKVCRICQRAAAQRNKGRAVTPDTVPVGPRNAEKTHCPAEHDYAVHGRLKAGGGRMCVPCHRESRLTYTYGLPRGSYERMLTEQDGACAGCLRVLDDENLRVDHDHACCAGKRSCGNCVRGLLCDDCNLVLGKVRDSAETLRRLADYVVGE